MRRTRPLLSGLIPLSVLLLLLVVAPSATGQGLTDYFNVESPQVHPIEVFTVGGHDYIAVCNTPDNSVEIWDTDETLPVGSRFVARVRTGLEPVSVRWHAGLSRLYTANFLGDSLSAIEVGSAVEGGLDVRLLSTTRVTDEPVDLAFAPGATEGTVWVFVTQASSDSYGIYDADSLAPVAPGLDQILHLFATGLDHDGDGLLDTLALKDPRTALIACGHLFVLSHRGGDTAIHDFDLYRRNLSTGDTLAFPGIGTNLFGMTFGPGGELFIVGQEARNAELRNEPMVRRADTGFVRSMLFVLGNPCTNAPTLDARDLNQVISSSLAPDSVRGISSRGTEGAPPTQPVAKAEALAQPTEVVIYQPVTGPDKAFLTAFASDRLGVLDLAAVPDPLEWPRRVIDISPVVGSDNPRSGPRGLALKPNTSSDPDATGPRIYVLNRLDNSVTVVDPEAETVVGEFALTNDPTPEYIRHGREFLYSAELSGNGFVSCASCHLDGRTDGRSWDLGNGPALDFLSALAQIQPIPPILNDNFTNSMTEFPVDKSWMVTQSLQGLLNFEVDQESQSFFTNAPYHWRGDREDFVAFNIAFEGLMGGQEIAPADMELFEAMVNSIHYPPNPNQPLDRIFSGTFGDPSDLDTGTGAQRGLKLFHGNNSSGLGSCGSCHVLPAGSNNRFTEQAPGKGAHTLTVVEADQPIETPTLRGLHRKEALIALNGDPTNPDEYAISGLEGVGHTGVQSPPNRVEFNDFASADRFAQFLFAEDLCGAPFTTCQRLQDLLRFVFEMDWGVAPRVGYALTVDTGNAASGAVATELGALEQEVARAHAGLAVQAWIGGVEGGFWLDTSLPGVTYREAGGPGTFTRAELLALLSTPDDRLVFLGAPLGSEPRLASPLGSAAPLAGPAPSNLEFLPLVPMLSYQQLPLLTEFYNPPPDDPSFIGFGGSLGHGLRLFQHGLIQDGPPGAFGITGVHWEAPRLFRVAGDNVRHGAQLHLFTHADPQAGTPPDLGLGPEDPGQVLMRRTVLPLYATDQRTLGGQVVWHTAAQAETELYLRLMLGGEFAPGVEAAYADNPPHQISEPPPMNMFDPVAWNWHYFRVVNADGTSTDGGWVRVTVE
jgi:hypothetical protein